MEPKAGSFKKINKINKLLASLKEKKKEYSNHWDQKKNRKHCYQPYINLKGYKHIIKIVS